MNINKVHICGNLTRDPQIKFLQNEKAVASFGIAINHTWKDANGEKKQDTTFVDIEAWGKTAELIGQYCTKGSELYVEGRLKLDTWEKDGQKHSKLKVVADVVQFGRKPNGASGEKPTAATSTSRPAAQAAPAQAAAATGQTTPPVDDEPPF